ncbi:MAG: hypothetical protein HY815_27415 [Candidatus Riflebacteria bacterium]|nr:hypothetical protein [Candidatus Riflebacteria bacterium]
MQLTGVERLLHSEGAVALIGRWRTALALQLVASRSTEGAWSAWIDLAGGFYPAGAARLGVRLSRLVWVRPPDLRGALWAAHVLLVGGAVRLVVVDLPELSALNRGLELSLTRLVRDARGGQRSLFILATAPLPGVKSTVYPREVNGRLIASFHERPRGGVHHGDSS